MKICMIALTLLTSCFAFAGPIEELECEVPGNRSASVSLSFLETHQMATLLDVRDGFMSAVASCGLLWSEKNKRLEKLECTGYYMESALVPANVSIDLLTKKGTVTTTDKETVEIVCSKLKIWKSTP